MKNGSYFNVIVRFVFVLVLILFNVIGAGCGTLVHHEVEKGDSLYSIGFYYGQDYRDIAQWNDISTPYVLKPGQWLRVAPPAEEWWEGRKQQNNNKPAKSDKNKKTIKSVGNYNNKYPVKSRLVQSEGFAKFAKKAGPVRSWLWPSEGKVLTPKQKSSVRNKGIDIAGKQGQPIRASAAGEIVYSGSGLIGYGKLIIIKHNKSYLSAYAHNEAMLVKEGDVVKQGQQIAKMGRTPDQHILLHFEIRKNGKPVNPLRLLTKQFRH